jgi:hypothetical protein
MQLIRYVLALAWVRVIRILLVLQSLYSVLTLGISWKFSLFPLTPFLNWGQASKDHNSDACESSAGTTVDVLVSLYRFEKYQPVLKESLESCFENKNITFHFVVVDGSHQEIEWIRDVVGDSHHKLYLVANRIGIYESWNKAILGGTGKFITNLNADDLRLPHSICSQAAGLEKESADGSYGNFYLSENILSTLQSFPNRMLLSKLGSFNEKTLVQNSLNFMHCAPMWKRSLHEKLGLFDESLKSSGDTDFWLRALSAGSLFANYAMATVVYFHNPEGLSTSLSSSGRHEWQDIRDRHLRTRYLN